MALWTLLYHSAQRRLNHWMAYNYPSDVKPCLPRVTEALHAMVAASFGSTKALDDALIRERMGLPVKAGGAGFRDPVDTVDAAFVGALWQVAPRLIDRRDGGNVAPGFAPDLDVLFGQGAFDPAQLGSGRFTGLVGGTSRLGDEYKTAYQRMRAEMLTPEDRDRGPLKEDVQNSGFGFEGGQGQRYLTKQRDAVREEAFKRKIADLPTDDFRRTAYLSIAESATSKMLMTAHPDRDFDFRPPEWWEVMRWFWGLPSYMLEPWVGTRIDRRATRIVDAYGMSLIGGENLRGDAWRDRHDHIKWGIYEFAHAMEVEIQCEVSGLFMRQCSAAALAHMQTAAGRQGIVPDFLVGGKKLADVKVVGLGKTHYVTNQPQTPTPMWAVTKREKKVNTEYLRLAHQKIDRPFHNTAPGDVGPMEAELRSYGDPAVTGLVAGHFGEIGRQFDDLLKDFATIGAMRLQAALYAKTPDQARAVLLHQLRRKTAALILTANLRCLQNRMQHLGTGNQGQAWRRRAQSRRRFFPGGDASWASYRYREEHENYPHGQTGPW